VNAFADWLTPRRLRAQAWVLAVCLWGVCAVDFSTPGLFDRGGNIKFQDFLPIYSAARLISQGRAAEIYDQQLIAAEMQSVIGQALRARLPYLYGPQVGLFFVPLTKLSFPVAPAIWATASLAVYFGCVLLLGSAFPSHHRTLLALAAIAYPPLFHLFVRGQNSAIVMACFAAAYLAFSKHHDWLAGIALGVLIFKPQFLIAIPLVLLFSLAWKALAGLILSAAAQIGIAWLYCGTSVMRNYVEMMLHAQNWLSSAELGQAAIQMHSLRAFWTLLIPWPQAAFALYAISSIAVIALATSAWKSHAPLTLRFSALTFTAVLVNPHLFIYDLLALAPALLLLANWVLENRDHPNANLIVVLSYLSFVLPLIGPLSRWTHIQFSVPVFVALLWTLWRTSQADDKTSGRKLASAESRVV
jgi:Glycosyltransferase family 87